MHDAYNIKTERLVHRADNWMLQKWRLMCFMVINLCMILIMVRAGGGGELTDARRIAIVLNF